MTDEPRTEDPRASADREIKGIVEDGLAKWRAALQQNGKQPYVTIAQESEMRRCIEEYERVKKGLPLGPRLPAHTSAVEWNVFTYLDAQQSQITQPPWKIQGLVV